MSKLSAALKLTDLDDYITPSQACIKPIELKKSETSSFIHIHRDEEGEYVEHEGETVTKLKKAHITLNDCLACSGCITSAETVLVSQQSYEEVQNMLDQNRKVSLSERKYVVVSVSPQSRASLAANYGLSPLSIMERLTGFFKTIGVDMVLDLGLSRDLSLFESAREFIERYQNSRLPMLASACPGWICYAEKTQGNIVLPYISTTKSPQQVMGSLVKSYLAESHWKVTADRVYHVTIMPCYDKKLEASRKDFYNDVYRTRDVDCVITTGELKQWLLDKGVDFLLVPEVPLDLWNQVMGFPDQEETLAGTEDHGAGGYLEYIFRYAAKHLFYRSVGHIEYQIQSKNPDFKEISLEVGGEVVLRFAAAYGFRNIMNLMRKIKTQKCPYHFVEVMACPSACLNGGGQIKEPSYMTTKEYLKQVESLYQPTIYRLPEENGSRATIYHEWLQHRSDWIQQHLHTQYHAVEKNLMNSLAVKW
jgi:iron only hydrogenase large subunit-like protein